jgi:hypothetical protein
LGQRDNPWEKASNQEIIPWPYATNKPFEDVIWRVFINHYLADDENVVNTDQIPPPPSVKSVALEALSDNAQNGPREEWRTIGSL